MRAVVLDALERTADEARRAVEAEPDPFEALVRYMHRALDIRTGAVIPRCWTRSRWTTRR